MGPTEHTPTAGEASEARTRAKQIRDFEYHWDGAYERTWWENGKFRTVYTANGHVITAENITDLRDEARYYYSGQHSLGGNST